MKIDNYFAYIAAIAFDHDEKVIAANLDGDVITIDGNKTKKLLHKFPAAPTAIAAGGDLIAVAINNTIAILATDGEEVDKIEVDNDVTCVAFSHDRGKIAIGTVDGGIYIFNVWTRERVRNFLQSIKNTKISTIPPLVLK